MIGLAGVYDLRADDSTLKHVVDRMRAALPAPTGPNSVGIASGAGMRCAIFQPEGGEAIARGRESWLAFDGELYNRADLEQRLRAGGAAEVGADNAALCLALFEREGHAFVRLLNGQFNLVVGRTDQTRLSIATDRVGYRPLFLSRRGGRALFATAIKAILAGLDITPGFDGVGLLQAMQGGWCLGNRTWVEGVTVVDPGSWLHVEGDKDWQERYFRLRFAATNTTGIDAHAEGLRVSLERAVRRTTDDGRRFALPLSGGLDSRAILAVTAPDRHPALAYTFGRDGCFDVAFARRLADIAGVPHQHFRYEPGYLARVLESIVWHNEALTGFAHAAFTSYNFHDQIARHAGVLLYGHAGDCLTGAHLPTTIVARRSVERLIARTFQQYKRAPEAVFRRIFNASFYRRHAADLFDAMRQTFHGIEGERVADVANVWDMENRQRRSTFPSGALDRHRFEVRAPFLDNDVIDHLLRAPLRWRLQQVAYKRMLVKLSSDNAVVPWAYTGRPIRSSLLADFVEQGWNYVGRRLRPAAIDPRQFRDLREDTRSDAALAQALAAFSRHPHFPGDIFDRTGFEDVVQRHWNRQDDFTEIVITLATFATAWRLFLYSPTLTASTATPAR